MKGSTAEKLRPIGLVSNIKGIKTGALSRIDEDGTVWVDYPGNPAGLLKARLTATVSTLLKSVDISTIGPVMLAFEENDSGRPIVVDAVCETIYAHSPALSVNRDEVDNVRIDGQSVTFDAKKEIVLRCGKASITLTRAGKVLIRGAYLLNRSSGVNRIKGGSVQIN